MRIALLSGHRYPAGGAGTGDSSNPRSTGGAAVVMDVLARGLAELGHEVYYYLEEGWDPPVGGSAPPEGVVFTDRPRLEVDVAHHANSRWIGRSPALRDYQGRGTPWVASCQVVHDLPDGRPAGSATPPREWVFASAYLAGRFGGGRWVHNAVDPSELVFSAAKGDYFAFLTRAEAAEGKGLVIALDLARDEGFELRVAASARTPEGLERVREACRGGGARFLGDLRGARKAELLAGARAVLFPTQYDEGFGMVIAESLMSGTPVIASDRGACPELIGPGVGFVCRDRAEYRRAVRELGALRPEDCRAWAMERFHFHRMARDFLREYERRLAGGSAAVSS